MLAGHAVRPRVSAHEAFVELTYRRDLIINPPSETVSPPMIMPHLPKGPTWGRGIHEQLCQHDVLLSSSFTGCFNSYFVSASALPLSCGLRTGLARVNDMLNNLQLHLGRKVGFKSAGISS